jgi:hypothetical protein
MMSRRIVAAEDACRVTGSGMSAIGNRQEGRIEKKGLKRKASDFTSLAFFEG